MRRQTNYALIAASLALSTTNEHQAVAFVPKLGISISPKFGRISLEQLQKKSPSHAAKTELAAYPGNNDGPPGFGGGNPFNSPSNNPFNSPSNNPFNSPPSNPFGSSPDNGFNGPPGNPFNSPPSNPFNSPPGAPTSMGFASDGPPQDASFSFSGFDRDNADSAADLSPEEKRAMEAAKGLQEKTAERLRQVEGERLAQNAVRQQRDEFRREAEEYVQEQKASIPRDQANAAWEAQSASRIEDAQEAARQKAEEMRNMYPESDKPANASPFGAPMPASGPTMGAPPSSPFAATGPSPASPNPFAPSAGGFGAGSSDASAPWPTGNAGGSLDDEKSRREAAKAQFRQQRDQQPGGDFMNDFKAQQEAAIKAEEEAYMQAQKMQSEDAKRQEQAANMERAQLGSPGKESFFAKAPSSDAYDMNDPRQAAIRAAEEKARMEANEAERMRRELDAQRKADQEAQNKRREEMQRRAAEENAKLEAEIEEKRKKAKEAREAAINAAKRKTEEEEKRKRGAEEDRKRKEEDRARESKLRAEESRLKAEAERNRQEIKDFVQNRRSEADAWRIEEQDRKFSSGQRFSSTGDAKLRADEAREWAQEEARRRYGGMPGNYEDTETARVRNVYLKWAEFYGKRYDEQRFATFRKNLVEIERHYNTAGGPVQLNEFADLTAQEYRIREQDPLRWEEEERRRAFESERRFEEEQMMLENEGPWDRRRGVPPQGPPRDGFPREGPRGDPYGRFDPWGGMEDDFARNQGPFPGNAAIDVDIMEQARRRGQYDAARKAQGAEKKKTDERRQEELEKTRIDELRRRGEAASRKKADEEAKREAEEEAKKRSIEEAKRRGEEEAIRRAEAEAKRLEEEAKELESRKKALDDARIRGQFAKQAKTGSIASDQQQQQSPYSAPGTGGSRGQTISDQREERLQAAKQSIFEGARMRGQQGSGGAPQQKQGDDTSTESSPWNIAMQRGQAAAQKRAEAEAKRKQEEAELEEQKKAYFETVKGRAKEDAKRREEAAKREEQEDAERKQRMAAEAKRRAQEEEAKRAEAAARRKEEQEKAAELKRKALEAARTRMEDEKRRRQEEEDKRKAEQARIAQEQFRAREEARSKAAAEAKRKTEEETKRRKEQIQLAAQQRERQQRERQQAAAEAKRKTEDIELKKAASMMKPKENRSSTNKGAAVSSFGNWQPGASQDPSNGSKTTQNQPMSASGLGSPAFGSSMAGTPPAQPQVKEPEKKPAASAPSPDTPSPSPFGSSSTDTPSPSPFGSYMDSLASSNGGKRATSSPNSSKPKEPSTSPFGSYMDSMQKQSTESQAGSPTFPPPPQAPSSTATSSFPSATQESTSKTTSAGGPTFPPPPQASSSTATSSFPPSTQASTSKSTPVQSPTPFGAAPTPAGPGSAGPGPAFPSTPSASTAQPGGTSFPPSTTPLGQPAKPSSFDRDIDPINTSLDDSQLERLKSEAITKRQVAEAALKRAQDLKQEAADELARQNMGGQGGPAGPEVGSLPQETSYMDKVAKSFVSGAAKLEGLNKEISDTSEMLSPPFGGQSESLSQDESQPKKRQGLFARIFSGKQNEPTTEPAEKAQSEGDDSGLPFFLSGMSAPSPASSLLGDIGSTKAADSTKSTDIPIIAAWGQTPEGSIYGFISNSPYFEDGAYIITTPVQKGATGGSIVETESGSQYLLAKDQEDFGGAQDGPR